MRLLNSGTLKVGRNLCVTVAIDHLTVDGFHDELQLSSKNTKGKALRRISSSQRMSCGSLKWISLQCCVFNLLKFHQFGSTRLPETSLPRIRLERGERSLERNSFGSRLWAGGQKKTRQNFTTWSSTRRRWSRSNGWQFQKPQMDKLKFIGGDQVLRTPTLTRYHPSSRRSSRRLSWRIRPGFHHRPKQEVIAHEHSLHRDSRYPYQNCFEKICGKTLSWTSSTSRLTPSITGKTSCYSGTGFIDDVFIVKLVYSYISDIINVGCQRFDTRSSINRMWERG